MRGQYIVLATGPYDHCCYGPFQDYEEAYDWAKAEWATPGSAVDWTIEAIYEPTRHEAAS